MTDQELIKEKLAEVARDKPWSLLDLLDNSRAHIEKVEKERDRARARAEKAEAELEKWHGVRFVDRLLDSLGGHAETTAGITERLENTQELIERVMTEHWDMAACMCLVCRMGRDLGFRPREIYLSPRFKLSKQLTDVEWNAVRDKQEASND